MEQESEINSTNWMKLTTAFYMHQAGDLKLVLFLVLVCGAHRNGVASYHGATRPGKHSLIGMITLDYVFSTVVKRLCIVSKPEYA